MTLSTLRPVRPTNAGQNSDSCRKFRWDTITPSCPSPGRRPPSAPSWPTASQPPPSYSSVGSRCPRRRQPFLSQGWRRRRRWRLRARARTNRPSQTNLLLLLLLCIPSTAHNQSGATGCADKARARQRRANDTQVRAGAVQRTFRGQPTRRLFTNARSRRLCGSLFFRSADQRSRHPESTCSLSGAILVSEVVVGSVCVVTQPCQLCSASS